jgi:hypothetical protein
MMRRFALMTVILVTLAAGSALAQLHSSGLPPLTEDATFPRCTDRELEVVGFPDHLHSHTWYGWEPMVGVDGETYGPGAFCDHKKLMPREGLVIHPDQKQFGQWILRHHPDYSDCDMVQFIELMDWAGRAVPPLLGLSTPDTLMIFNPDNVNQYKEMTGMGTWRFYKLEGDRCVMQPWPILQKRTLEGHAAFMLAADWTLRRTIGDALPVWMHQGIIEYVSEDGAHLLNYMAQFRPEFEEDPGGILMSAPLIDALLSSGINPDDSADRENFRRACYSSFLMVWNLVENEGGLTALQDFLGQVDGGMDVDEAARRVYGMGLADLATFLDPAVNGEPVGAGTSRRAPHQQP